MFSPYCPQEKPHKTGFSLGRLHMGGFGPPMTSTGGQSINVGGLMRGDIDLMEGYFTLIDYIIN